MIWTHVIIHHSLTADGATVSWQAIRRYHIETNGWRDIGYHFGIELVNSEYEVFVGRDLNEVGAHCLGMNDKAIGVCFVGNFDLASPPPPQWKRGLKLVRNLMSQFEIPASKVLGHRDFASKSCPGTQFDLDLFRSQL